MVIRAELPDLVHEHPRRRVKAAEPIPRHCGLISVAVVVSTTLTAFAVIARLTAIPLGRGTATITWTGKGGISPTVNSIGGTAGGFRVTGSDKVPSIYGSEKPSTGPPPTALAIPSVFPVANVTGTIDGASFTLKINLSLTVPSSAATSLGNVTGTFRNQPISANITANSSQNAFDFTGTIGSVHVTGVVKSVKHDGNKATARATFDVTK